MKRFVLFIIISFVLCKPILALVPVLEREVNLSFKKESIENVLAKIREQTGSIFSYQPLVLNAIGPITMEFKQRTVREVLSLILPKTIVFKAKNDYIILKEKIQEKSLKKTELSGYVYDKNTDKKLSNVTIYDKNTLQSVTTNQYGFYSISVPINNQCLSVNKESYRDTCVSIIQLQNSSITNISIDPISVPLSGSDSLKWRKKAKNFGEYINNFFRSFKGYINTINVTDTLTRNFQISLVPFVGTNALLSGNVKNKYSINIFGGYSLGTEVLEVGGLFNVDRGKVTGAQLAGLFNLVSDSVRGIQLAGLCNITGRNMNGFQGAGLMNINRFSVKGVQIAGMANLSGDTLIGGSLAGFVNLNWYSKKSLEMAGVLNAVRYGQNNYQVAGLMNLTSKGSTNLQISGLLNKAHNLKGVQIGLFNYADSASGIPIGLLSIVKNGLHQIEFSSDEVFYGNISVRSGVNKFYNIFTAGIQPSSNQILWSIGYGLGTSVKLKNKLSMDLTTTSSHISSGNFYFATSELFKFYVGFEYKFAKKISIAAGPTFNIYWSDALLPDYTGVYSKIGSHSVYNKTNSNDFNQRGWFGARISIRFF